MPFRPLAVCAPDDRAQSLHPSVDSRGAPRLEAGDTEIVSWPVISLADCHGSIGNAKQHPDVSGRLHVTAARVLAVAADFAQGTHHIGLGLIADPVANWSSKRSAGKSMAGRFLVGQMRMPWVSDVGYSVRKNRKTPATIRICGSHRTDFGDQETVMLIAGLPDSVDPRQVAEDIVRRVLDDRLGWEDTTPQEEGALRQARLPHPSDVAAGQIPVAHLVGSFVVSPRSGYLGTNSVRSRPAN